MRSQIWKFLLPVRTDGFIMEWNGRFNLDLPKASTILSAQLQHGQIAVWALVTPDADRESRSFILAATGKDVPRRDDEAILFIATVQIDGGNLVLHLFESLGVIDAQKN
jgi:hypothetical protein